MMRQNEVTDKDDTGNDSLRGEDCLAAQERCLPINK